MDGWMRMEHRSSDSDKGKSKYSEKNLVPVPLSPSQNRHGLVWGEVMVKVLQCRLSEYTGPLQCCQHVLNRYNADCQHVPDQSTEKPNRCHESNKGFLHSCDRAS